LHETALILAARCDKDLVPAQTLVMQSRADIFGNIFVGQLLSIRFEQLIG